MPKKKPVTKKKPPTKAVAKRGSTEVGKPLDFSADAGKGMEGSDADTFALPFVNVLQPLSPQMDTIDGAKAGMFFNSITMELFKTVRVIPCAFQRRFLRWAPRDQGGGFKGIFHPSDIESGKIDGVERDENGFLSIDGDDLRDTRSHYCLVYSEKLDTWTPAVISMSSTQVKKSKRFMSMINGLELKKGKQSFTPPSFSHIYEFSTVKEENEKGKWFGIEMELVGPVEDASLYAKGRAFNEQVLAGEVKVSDPVPETSNGDDDDF